MRRIPGLRGSLLPHKSHVHVRKAGDEPFTDLGWIKEAVSARSRAIRPDRYEEITIVRLSRASGRSVAHTGDPTSIIRWRHRVG